MAQMLQLIFTLSTLISITVSSDVFGMVGESVQLYTQNPGPEFRTIFWVFNGSENVVEYSIRYKDVIPSVHYKDRVEFNNETYSLTLKNLQKTDSGLYEARASDPVEAPVLTLNKDTCNMSCRSPDFSINSSCYYETCEEENLTLAGVTLSLYINGHSIICNHSNAVSWKKAVLEMGEHKQYCDDAKSSSVGVSLCLLKTVLFSISLTLMLSAILTIHIRERTRQSS
ncbi:CD48 antigen-like [Hoplias malabaricus]|uniref:CD48 antigen-like n=1 Tax=Hoplias malabaricus TaxID=27720 RepID=UPI003462F498